AAAKDYTAYAALTVDDKSANRGVTPRSTQQAALNLAEVRYRNNQWDEADAQLTKLLATPSLDTGIEQEALFQRVLVLVKLGKVDDALAAIGTLLDKFPQTSYLPDARYYR